MSKKKTTPLQWVIRILIVLLFCTALLVGFRRLLERNELERQKQELEDKKEQIEQQID